ncbi:agmatine deiminase [Cohaesibacter gelatinilyticus]|uniref:Agmatine deiminase n=2 Tax=Cohaesibacter gelatinilyticus TaxID=372072 RepID=A0A285NAI1_9HYPH|nr:agmatine deiminase [Cohaesibacter gelatinilyticus]
MMGLPVYANEDPVFIVPPEEDPHELTFMQWPTDAYGDGDKGALAELQQTIAGIANAISDFEPVILLADGALHRQTQRLLSENVELWDIPTDDLWCRDSGPLFGKKPDGSLIVSQIQFNSWGGRFNLSNDELVAKRVAERLGLEIVPSGIVGEPGGAEQSGHGLLFAHESSWVNDNRNPNLSRTEIEEGLLAAYGAEKLIWAKGVKGQDVTDYHIDSLARFTGQNTVLMNLPDEPNMDDVFHLAALETYETLKAEGLEIDVIPDPVAHRVQEDDFVASYANYYVCNGAVIAAQFGDRETDAIAKQALQKHYPGREVIALNVDALGYVGGGIHCATQQMPVSGQS